MGEAVIQRDERSRVIGLTVRGDDMSVPAKASATHLLQAVAASLEEYLHVPVEAVFADEIYIEVDRSDPHLDREIDAILETMRHGLRIVAEEYPSELAVHEATVGVEV